MVETFPGKGSKYILSSQTEWIIVKEAKRKVIAEIGYVLGSPNIYKKIQWHLHTSKFFGRVARRHWAYWTQWTKPSIFSLQNLIGIMTGRECYGQISPTLNVLAIHTIDKMHTRRSTSYLLSDMSVVDFLEMYCWIILYCLSKTIIKTKYPTYPLTKSALEPEFLPI